MLQDLIRKRVRRAWRRMLYLIGRFDEDHCLQIAGSLTYLSLFALVPLMTVVYTMASAIPAFQGLEVQLQDFIFENLVPETSIELQTYLSDFSDQAKNLTGFGIAFLVITAILMLRNIEKAFNLIWRTAENRNAVSSFLLYWAVLSLAPITIGLALGISTYMSSLTFILDDLDAIGMALVGLRFAPVLLFTFGFTLLYATVPNARVPFKHALVGGFLAALVFNLARSLFTDLVVGSSYTLIYGAFAAVPLFLVWIYLSWNIVLLGGVLVHSFMAYQDQEQAERPVLLKALDLLNVFWRHQQLGEPVRELPLLRNRYPGMAGLDSETWRDLRVLFIRNKVISENSKGHFFLCRDLSTLPYWQLKEWINHELPVGSLSEDEQFPWKNRAYGLLKSQRDQQRDLLEMSLADLFDE